MSPGRKSISTKVLLELEIPIINKDQQQQILLKLNEMNAKLNSSKEVIEKAIFSNKDLLEKSFKLLGVSTKN